MPYDMLVAEVCDMSDCHFKMQFNYHGIEKHGESNGERRGCGTRGIKEFKRINGRNRQNAVQGR